VALVEAVTTNTINQSAAKKVLGVMFETGQAPQAIVKALGLEQISDEGQLVAMVQQVLIDHPGPVEQFKAGKEGVINFLVGQVMRASRGKANPKVAEEALRQAILG
jgi:aspartyl-tRNA(Asn)/glutamyl-tRNA(Gln) amidotransferase subunit B